MHAEITRLDFSKPPPGYELAHIDGMWWWGQSSEWLDGTSYLDCERAIGAAWAHYKGRHNPPWMWVDFCAVLPPCDQYRPRMGLCIPGVAHLELYVTAERPGTHDEAWAIGRAAAWAWYERRLSAWHKTSEVIRRTFGDTVNGVFCAAAVESALWRDILAWPNDKMDEHEKQLATAGGREATHG